MSEQIAEINQQTNSHSHKVLYTSLVLLLGSVVMLLIVVGVFYYKSKNTNLNTGQNKTQSQTVQPENQVAQIQAQDLVTPMSIATKQDLNTQLNTLDNTDTEVITAGLDQNSADALQFSQ